MYASLTNTFRDFGSTPSESWGGGTWSNLDNNDWSNQQHLSTEPTGISLYECLSQMGPKSTSSDFNSHSRLSSSPLTSSTSNNNLSSLMKSTSLHSQQDIRPRCDINSQAPGGINSLAPTHRRSNSCTGVGTGSSGFQISNMDGIG